MEKIINYSGILTLIFIALFGCEQDHRNDIEPFTGEAEILQAWQGDYPVNRLHLLPDDQKDNAVGYISNENNFSLIWEAYKPEKPQPELDFDNNLVLFARNIRYYNRISIGQVKVVDGVAEILAMETMSALPIENNLALSLAVVPRNGIKAIKVGDNTVVIR
jgi:hypothetical protein